MDSLKQSVADLADTFNKRMAGFQRDLEGATATSSAGTTTQLVTEFDMFRTFVMTSLACLQSQIEILMKLHDTQETRSRRKMLLLHGVPEEARENTASVVNGIVSKHFKLHDFSMDSFKRCNRMGKVLDEKPRPILIKLSDVSLRDQLWFSKTVMKGTKITISEFLTKPRHEAFMAARGRFGIHKCWTREGSVYVVGANGARHRVVSIADVDAIPVPPSVPVAASSQVTGGDPSKDGKVTGSRPKRNVKAK